MRKTLVTVAAAVALALTGAGVAFAADDPPATGPDTTACATAGQAVAAARTLLDAKAAATAAGDAATDALTAASEAGSKAVAADAHLAGVDTVAGVQARIDRIDAALADEGSLTVDDAKRLHEQRDSAAAYLAALTARDNATAAADKAAADLDAAGGETALADLAVAGGIGALTDAQTAACTAPGDEPAKPTGPFEPGTACKTDLIPSGLANAAGECVGGTIDPANVDSGSTAQPVTGGQVTRVPVGGAETGDGSTLR